MVLVGFVGGWGNPWPKDGSVPGGTRDMAADLRRDATLSSPALIGQVSCQAALRHPLKVCGTEWPRNYSHPQVYHVLWLQLA